VRDIRCIADILVSTDDPATAEVARAGNALVPWLRPAELASDTASSVDVALHALDWFERERGPVDGLLLLQPTSPFRKRETIERGLALYERHRDRAVVGLSPAREHPSSCFRLEGDSIIPFVDEPHEHLRSQDLAPAYIVNGAFYLVPPDMLRRERSFYGASPAPLIARAPEEALDIDTEWDWMLAEAVLRLGAISR
jgi:N-acylneuraminate cytidylyltransferase